MRADKLHPLIKKTSRQHTAVLYTSFSLKMCKPPWRDWIISIDLKASEGQSGILSHNFVLKYINMHSEIEWWERERGVKGGNIYYLIQKWYQHIFWFHFNGATLRVFIFHVLNLSFHCHNLKHSDISQLPQE